MSISASPPPEFLGSPPTGGSDDAALIAGRIRAATLRVADRAELVAALKTVMASERDQISDALISMGQQHAASDQEPVTAPGHAWGGRRAAAALSAVTDAAITAIHRMAIRELGADAGALAVVAQGGYGRGRMAPHSDVDVLFLPDPTLTQDAERVAEWMLYALWDLGLKIGHATRDVASCAAAAADDATIRTALIEARHVCGQAALTEALVAQIYDDLDGAEGRRFVSAKLAERDARHERDGDTRYHVEPNVKEGKGGQRDLQTLYWIGKAIYRIRDGGELLQLGVFEADEAALFADADDFQWAVRCNMHLIRGRADEVLSFDLQPEVARRMGFEGDGAEPRPGGARSPVERFMRRYFQTAKAVGDLTRVLCADLEERHVTASPTGLGGLVRRVTGPWRRRTIPGAPEFVEVGGRIALEEGEGFAEEPRRLIRMFHLADLHALELHPATLKLATRSLDVIDDTLRADDEANRLFLAILSSPRKPAEALKRMSEAGVLGRFVPPFERITAMMQFSMYHRYTVDQHLIRTVAVYREIADGDPQGKHPLAVKLLPLIDDPLIVPVACFLHDIAKGREEDHSVAGAREARELCPRFGMSPAQTEAVAWLIECHLTMSMTAQTRDLSDRRTIEDFAKQVHTLDRLRMLLVLTVCDIRAVGPGVWNGWKGQLLRTLYRETEFVLTGGHGTAGDSTGERARHAREDLAARLVDAGWPLDQAAAHAALHYPPYLIAIPPAEQIALAAFVRDADREAAATATDDQDRDGATGEHAQFATRAWTDGFEGWTRIAFLASDHPRLLTVIAGACAAAGANIVDAQISTMKDGRALDVVTLARGFERDEDELRRAARIGTLTAAMMRGERQLGTLLDERAPKTPPRAQAFDVVPKVAVRNDVSNRFTVVEIECADRPGLLSDVASELSALNLDIASAHITTFGEKAVDAFYVTDLFGAQVSGEMRRWRIRERVLAALRGERLGDLRRGQTAAQMIKHGA